MTGQETPNTDKPLREDLHKKVMSGDPVAARLPYAILTKMVTFVEWKRFEMNASMKFHGITEGTFPSIVILCKGKFVSADRLARLPPGAQGYFLMQEDMKDLMTSKPAAGALFTILVGDLSQFSVDRFREKIETYADGGGDGGLARATTRLACGLDQEPHAPGSTGGPVHAPGTHGLHIGDQEVEPVGSRHVAFVVQSEQDNMLRNHVSLLTHSLNDGLNLCSEYQVSKRPLDVWPRVLAKDRLSAAV